MSLAPARLLSRAALAAALAAGLAAGGCAKNTGVASWYGPTFHGRTTASGERYNMLALTAAHRTLAFGAYVRVTNLTNGRRLVVRVNDRGPFVRGRIIDLSYAAAKILQIPDDGTARVKLEQLRPDEGGRIHRQETELLKRKGVRSWTESDLQAVGADS